MDNKYVHGKIYKLVNDVDDKIYVGSTTQPLLHRFSDHKYEAKRHPERRVYDHLFEIGWTHVTIQLIEEYPCTSLLELRARERHWVELLDPKLNTNRAHMTKDDRREDYIAYHRKYRTQHRAEIRARDRDYYNRHRDDRLAYANKEWRCMACGCTTRLTHKSQHLRTKKHLANLAALALPAP